MAIDIDLFNQIKKVNKEHKERNVKKTYKDNINNITFSKEQQDFLNCNESKILLNALAGTGKTTLLMEYAKIRPHKIWNFIVFNRSNYEKCIKEAPKNVIVNTVHQIAFKNFGKQLSHKIKEEIDKFDLKKNDYIYKTKKLKYNDLYNKLLLKTFYNFLNSSCKIINESLIDNSVYNKALLKEKKQELTFNKNDVIEDVKNIWKYSINEKSSFPCTHECYLKRFCMVNHNWMGNNWILDEAQDWSDCLIDSFLKNTKNSIIAGDPCQRLYEDKNQFNKIENNNFKVFWLSKSFRTPNSIASYVNYYLDKLKLKNRWSGLENKKSNDIVKNIEQNINNIKEFNPDVIISSRWKDLEEIAQILKRNNIDFDIKKENQVKNNSIIYNYNKKILLSTIHSCKGLEFNNVWICDNIFKKEDSRDKQYMLAYIALTRHIRKCRIPYNFKEIVSTKNNNFDDEDLFENIF